VTFFLATLLNLHWRYVQKSHALLVNFSRVERSEVYRKAKGIDSSSAFGSLLEFDRSEIKLRHSLYPVDKEQLEPFDVAVGAARGLATTHHITRPVMISAMSYGALGENAVRSLARGTKLAGATMNTGEGGYPEYHLMEGCDLTFQLGTAKFGVRGADGRLDEDKLRALAALEPIKMIEIKLSQGAKPGKGGLLPKEKITAEIAELRGVPMGQDVISPAHHVECVDAASTVRFIGRIQDVSGLPTGIKFCLGRPVELLALVREMKRQDIVPDFITVDGGEGGTGAAPKSFMDDLGLPLFEALPIVHRILQQEGVRHRLVLFASGKLISPGKQMQALSLGADVAYTARGFLLALGCIQALQCNRNTCPAGITTHEKHLQHGLDIDDKAKRVANYIEALHHDHIELLAAMGKSSAGQLDEENVYLPMQVERSVDGGPVMVGEEQA